MSLTLTPASIVSVGGLWTAAVNRNQNLLGKTMLVCRRPVVTVAALSADEWQDLHRQIGRLTGALDALFRPDQYNHAFLMNVDAQVHLHVVPRYRQARVWQGRTFTDPHFGTLFGTEQEPLDEAQLVILAAEIRDRLAE
jgi:diadenosine tetraphosphate (Ap4A) HIT family hydrolase